MTRPATIETAFFYKVTFDANDQAVITPLEKDQVWSAEGLDKNRPFIVINPGDTFLNVEDRKEILPQAFKEKVITPLVKIFERAAKKYNVAEARQYLVTVNDRAFGNTTDLVKDHNEDPDSFITPHAQEQALAIYGPLIMQNGTRLPDAEILRNLSKARNYNECLGAISANCHINVLVQKMEHLGISAEVIKSGIENMRRIDAPNIVYAKKSAIAPSTVIFEGSNDKLAASVMSIKIPPLAENHDNLSIAEIDDHRIKIYQRLPEEVYNQAAKFSVEKEAEKNKIIQGLPKIYEERFRNPETKIVGRFAKIAARALAEERQNPLLKDLDLFAPRYKDKRTHSLHHLTMEATPSNEISGRDHNLFHKLIADMLVRENAKDVLGYFKRAAETSKSSHSGIAQVR